MRCAYPPYKRPRCVTSVRNRDEGRIAAKAAPTKGHSYSRLYRELE